jgi:Fe-S cluster assembly protein SufD
MSALDQKRWNDFISTSLPTRREEPWKYTDVSFLTKKKFADPKRLDAEYLRDKVNAYRIHHGESIILVCVNGYFMPTLSDTAKLPQEVIVRSLNEALIDQSELIQQHWLGNINAKRYPFASVNTALFTDGLFLLLSDNCEINIPVHLLSLAADENEFIAQPHHLIVVGAHSKLTLVEEYAAATTFPYFMNIVTTIRIGNNARFEHYKIQTENDVAAHMANTFIHQKQDSIAAFMNFSSGGIFARDDLVVKLQETGAECRTAGFYRLQRNNQYIDHHVDITHNAARSHSEMLYKGILDKKSQAVFNGRLCVEKEAQKILAYQANHNLLISNNAEVYSKPELEIYADDVKCKHGATTGQLDQDALFYLRSRGIGETEAMNILLQGFAEEIIQRIGHPGIRQRAEEAIL